LRLPLTEIGLGDINRKRTGSPFYDNECNGRAETVGRLVAGVDDPRGISELSESTAIQPRRSSSSLPIGLLGMLALVAVVELILAGRRLDFTTVWADDWRRTAEAASNQARGRDVLCFGDSLIKFGVLPRVIESKTGLTSFNLAVSAGPMPAEYFLFRRSLEAGARPKAVVADFFALMLPDRPRGSIRNYPELASLGDCVDLARNAADGDLLTSILLGKALPSVRCRFEIRASITGAFEGRRASPWPASQRIWKTWKQQLGAQPMPKPPGLPTSNPALVADLTPDRWACDPINADYFDRFMALAGSNQVPVFWVMPPLSAEIESGRVAKGTAAAYTRFARDALARFPNLVVLDARGAGYDESVHIDPIHLSDVGASVLTGDIAGAIVDHLDGRTSPRWLDLPPYAGRSGFETVAPEVAVGRPSSSPAH